MGQIDLDINMSMCVGMISFGNLNMEYTRTPNIDGSALQTHNTSVCNRRISQYSHLTALNA